MNTKIKPRNAKLQEWTQLISDQQNSGLNAKQWCINNQISYDAFNYWKKQLKKTSVDQMLPDIVPLPIPQAYSQVFTPSELSESVSLTINGFNLELDASVPDAFLSKLIKAVRYA